MNQADLVESMAKKLGAPKSQVEEWLKCFRETVRGSLKKKESVRLVGFGTFGVADRKARVGRNPQTGDEIKIEARRVPTFRPGRDLKDAVAKKKRVKSGKAA